MTIGSTRALAVKIEQHVVAGPDIEAASAQEGQYFGQPFSAEDVAYTFSALKELGPKVRFGVDVQQVLQDVKTTDSNTVVLKFKVPAPEQNELLSAVDGTRKDIVERKASGY